LSSQFGKMTTKYNWWVEILDATDDFILGVKDILGTIDHENESGDATGTLHPGNGINYALLAVWIKANLGGIGKTNIKVSNETRFFFGKGN
jgi:hypothetical protein